MQKIQSYEITDMLGVGGMGVVQKAYHSFRKETVAIKTLSPQFAHDEQFRERFRNEARILNALDHPNIVRVVDFIEEPGQLHLVMEYIEGKTLDKLIGQVVGPIPHERALSLFSQMLDGVRYAHSKNILHRDLKPANIMVTPTDDVKIMDFGIAKLAGQTGLTKTGTKMGTLFYMSPEQIRGEHVDERSDIYSLGMTLYEMLAGRLPFRKDGTTSEFTIMNMIVNDPIPDPRDFYPAIPEWLVGVLFQMLEKEKQKRTQTSKALLHSLTAEKQMPESPLSALKAAPAAVKELPKLRGSHFQNARILEPEMVSVQGGWYEMGSDDGQSHEKPVHRVYVNDFRIGKYEVTQKEWQEVMGNNPSYWKGDNLPVECVSWNDIQEFLAKLKNKTGQNYRLPTEAEWEYAARGGNKSRGYKYSGSNSIDEVAWYNGNSGYETHPVGTKQPNELGIYDMSGNVWEWCGDWYDRNYYGSSPQQNPKGPNSGTLRVLRGGSWVILDNDCRSASRYRNVPAFRNSNVGFRFVLD